MKILHLISGGDSGGAKTALYSLLSSPCQSVSVTVGCLTDGEFYRDLPPEIDRRLFLQKSRFDLSVVRLIADELSDGGYDLLHAHGARANFVAMLVQKRVCVPTVTTLHSDYLLDFESPVKQVLFTPLAYLALKKIPYRIAVSEDFRRMLTERGFDPNTTFTVYNGLDVREAGERPLLDPSAPVIGCVARLDRVKGVDVFLRAAATVANAIPNTRFLIAGDGKEREKLRSLVSELGLGEHVKFLGHVRDTDAFYNKIDINVIPSRSESFPYSMLEGAARSLPTVASAVGGIPDFIDDGRTGLLFPSEDFHALADAILRLIREPSFALALGHAAKKRLEDDFSSEKTAKTYESIYKSILLRENERKTDGKTCDFVISGYYGYGNIGDDAVLASIIDSIRDALPDATFTVLSCHPRKTAEKYGVNSRLRYFAPLSCALRSSRVLISGGGTLLQSRTSTRSLYYYLHVLRAASRLGLGVIEYANGFGPITSRRALSRTAKTVNECVDVFTSRDASALARARSSGIYVRMLPSADPTLLSSSPPSAPARGNYILCALCECDGAEKTVAQAAASLAKKSSARIVYLVMHPSRDLSLARSLARKFDGEVLIPTDKAHAREVISGASLLFAMRLHAVIFGVMSSTPTVAVAYDEKVSGFADEVSLPCLDACGLTHDALILAAQNARPCTLSDELILRARVSRDEAIDLLAKTKNSRKRGNNGTHG